MMDASSTCLLTLWMATCVVLNTRPPRYLPAAYDAGGAAEAYDGASDDAVVGYLAQHSLLDQIPALAADICTPDYCTLGEGKMQSVNAWLGPAGTVTPLHHDPHHNLLAQVGVDAHALATPRGCARWWKRKQRSPVPRRRTLTSRYLQEAQGDERAQTCLSG